MESLIPNIIGGIRKYYSVSPEALEALFSHMSRIDLPKNHLLTKAGEISHHIYFIEKGCTRTYFLANGKEITNWFSCEGDITFSSWSFYHRQAGHDYVQLIENSVIYSVPIDQMNQLFEKYIDLANWSRCIHQEVLLRMQTLRLDQLRLSAEARYIHFVQNHPDLIHRAQLGHIASYLGMSQQHLSYLRANVRF